MFRRAGLASVGVWRQGIDPSRFTAGPTGWQWRPSLRRQGEQTAAAKVARWASSKATSPARPPSSAGDDGLFVVFSGGKLEHRKGQDIVIAAMRNFTAAHPEAMPQPRFLTYISLYLSLILI